MNERSETTMTQEAFDSNLIEMFKCFLRASEFDKKSTNLINLKKTNRYE